MSTGELKLHRNGYIMAVVVAALGLSFVPILPTVAQAPSGPRPIRPLTKEMDANGDFLDRPPASAPEKLDAIVKNRDVLLALGKALFWDVQVGAANGIACASCHYHAGVDTRTFNQLSPGLRAVSRDATFGSNTTPTGSMGSGGVAGPNLQLASGDFPFHKLANPADREPLVRYDTNDVVSSNGAFQGALLTEGEPGQVGQRTRCSTTLSHDGFKIPLANGTEANTRKVERRNTSPSVNTAFNHRNLWDGRASNVFNGVDAVGFSALADPAARVWVSDGASLQPSLLQLENTSAASQAVGPVLNDFETTCKGMRFPDVARRLMQQRALKGQAVAADDSVFSRTPGLSIMPASVGGLGANYRELVRAAFKPAYWQLNGFYTVDRTTGQISRGGGAAGGYQLDELNFTLFFGLAVDAYERSLVSDESPFDKTPSDPDYREGRAIFEGKGGCANCHDGPLFSRAMSVHRDGDFRALDRTALTDSRTDPTPALHDAGYYNIGVRPSHEDIGVGGVDTRGKPLSYTRQFVLAPGTDKVGTDLFSVDPCRFRVPFNTPNPACLPSAAAAQSQRVAVDGAFKTPSLRNVALTAPYFHNGGQRSLEDVVAFYNRGGDLRAIYGGDTTGTGPLGRPVTAGSPVMPGIGSNAATVAIAPLRLTDQQQAQLVAFLKTLTDPRVACHMAPFDHPELTIPNGHLPQDANRDGNADDKFLTIRAVGAKGYANCATQFEKLNSGELFQSSAAFEALNR